MSWRKLLQHIPPDMGGFAIDFYGACTRDIQEFFAEVELGEPPFHVDVLHYNRLGKYVGWVPHKDRYAAYEAENPIICKIKVFDFEEAREICCEPEESFHNISLEEVLNIEY